MYKLIACLELMSRAGLWWSLSSCCSRQWPSLALEVTRWHWHSGAGTTEKAFLTKPETTRRSPGFTLPPTLETWQCLAKQFKKTDGTGPKSGLDWRTPWIETSHFKLVGVRKFRHFCGLKHASNSYWYLLASARSLGTGSEIQTQVLGQLFLLEIHLLPVPNAHKAKCKDSFASSLFEIYKSSI